MGIEQIHLIAQRLGSYTEIVGDSGTFVFPLFGGYDDNTVGAARTINSGSGSIFQHINGFNVAGID
ncbi:hypothetical protein Barb7_02138 [Bacteroidales bacterium Barb7]|nr:hypothetical protein Barb7_02138 [Bacteroidales bacterium Barb7]